MKSKFIKFLCLVMTMVTLFCVFSICASALTVKSNTYNNTTTVFYVKTQKSIWIKSIKLSMSKGELRSSSTTDSLMSTIVAKESKYGIYKIDVDRWDSKKSKWVNDQDMTVKNSSSKTIYFGKSNTVYRVKITCLGATDTVKIYGLRSKFNKSNTYVTDYCWYKLPKCSTGKTTRCSVYSNNPVK